MVAQRQYERVHDRMYAGRQMLRFGLPVVVYMPPTWNNERAGKLPLRDPETGTGRWIVRDLDQLNFAVRRVPDMNLAVLGLVVVDTDNAAAVQLAGDLGVNSDDACWILRSRKGWHVLYRPTKSIAYDVEVHEKGERARTGAFKTVTKNGDADAEDEVGLDLIMPYTPAIIPPSVHRSGHVYRWIDGHSPDDIPFHQLAEPPSLLMDHWSNLCRPRFNGPSAPVQAQPGTLTAAVRSLMEQNAKGGSLGRENSKGWIEEIHCIYPSRHGGEDRKPSGSVNFQQQVYKCWSCDLVKSFVSLARDFNLPGDVVTGHGRRTRIESPWMPVAK